MRWAGLMVLVQANTWYELPKKGASADYDYIQPEVEDLVRISKKAHSVGRGELVWMCWQPAGAGTKPARVNSISSGLMMVMMTRKGADGLQKLFDGDREWGKFAVNHFDLELKNWLVNGNNAEKLGACYLTPPCGNYSTHQSGCDPDFAVKPRPSCWNEAWVCRGTRESDDPKHRHKWLVSWTKKGEPIWLTKAGVNDTSPNWTSFWAGSESGAPTFRPADARRPQKKPAAAPGSSLAGKGIEPTAMPRPPVLPPPPPPQPGSTSAARKGKGRKHPWPKARPPEQDPIEEESSTEPAGSAKRTKRTSRFARQVLLYRTFRTWVTDRSQAEIQINVARSGECICKESTSACG